MTEKRKNRDGNQTEMQMVDGDEDRVPPRRTRAGKRKDGGRATVNEFDVVDRVSIFRCFAVARCKMIRMTHPKAPGEQG